MSGSGRVGARPPQGPGLRAITVTPRTSGSARLDDVPEPGAELGSCARGGGGGRGMRNRRRDRERSLRLGAARIGALILGHESLGRVVDPGSSPGCGGRPGRRDRAPPDPVPCPNCAVGEWDMCRNGQYTERGIKQRRRLHVRTVADRARATRQGRPVARRSSGVLLEPTTVVAKAWEHIAAMRPSTSGNRERVLVTGAGPIGMLGRAHRRAAGPRGARPRQSHDRCEAGARQGPRRHLPHRTHPGSRRGSGYRSSSAPGSGRSFEAPSARSAARRGRLPHRCGRPEVPNAGSAGQLDQVARAEEQGPRRFGQRQPPTLLSGRRGPC